MASDERLHGLAGLRSSDKTTPASEHYGTLAEMPNPATGFGHLSDGVALPIHRPLALDYQLPDRGTEAHGVDNDIPSDDMTGNDNVLIAPPEPYDGPQWDQQLIPPVPVPVAVVSSPIRSELAFTDLFTVIGNAESWDGAITVGTPYLPFVRQALPYDDTRTEATFFASTPRFLANVRYFWALSTSRTFETWVPVGSYGPGGINLAPTTVTVRGKNAFYATIIPAEDLSTAPLLNFAGLFVNVTRRQLVNQTL